MKGKRIVSRARNNTKPGKTNWQRVAAMNEKEIMAAAKSDPDARPTDLEFWKDAKVVLPERKQPGTLRIDRDILPGLRLRGSAISRG